MPASLKEYNKKRDFKQTTEPAGDGKIAKNKKQLSFVVQRHHATRLHYDFRLELNGTLKSWAVPKGPSLNPADKRLAMMVEDHPYDYKNFYGFIPEGNYGAGEVEIWDEGFYFPVNEEHEAITHEQAQKNLDKGELKVLLAGTHLSGEFVLVKLKSDEKSWLLIKHRDDYSTDKKYDISKIPSIKKKAATKTTEKKKNAAKPAETASKKATKATGSKASAKTREDGDKPAEKAAKKAAKKATKKAAAKKTAAKKTAAKKTATKSTAGKTAATTASSKPGKEAATGKKKASAPASFKPMLAYTASEAFDDPDWVFEYKWDGYRTVTIKSGDDVQLYSRNELSFNSKYPAIVEAISESIHHDVVLDGEVVAVVDGKISFQALQHAAEVNPELRYYIFDLLFLDGESIMHLPLTDRKTLLQQLLENAGHEALLYSEHTEKNGKAFFEKVRKENGEGIIAKKAESGYHPGSRTRDWLKIKNRNDREAIIVGYTEGGGSRKYFGALVLAERTGNSYRYIGHTGTGFNDKTLKELYNTMQPLVTGTSPFKEKIKVNAPVTWIEPKLVCTVFYSEETNEGLLRHPVYAGLRPDKSVKDITPEPDPVEVDQIKEETDMETIEETATGKQELVIGTKKIPVTNLDKIYFPEKKITKGDVIAYYHSIAPFILPHIKDRPMSLKRNPNGIHGESFYHKNAGDKAPSWVKTFENYSDSSNRTIEYVICNDAATLVYLANLGCIEMNPWNAVYKKPDHPTWLAIDLDPSDGNSFEQVIETALAVKEVTDKAGIECYCKTSGASGLHIYLPVAAKYDYDVVRTFAEMIAIATHELVPEFTSVERSLKKRGQKIYVDYLQNRSNQTLACAYSLRPVEAASVSTPLEWKEVKKGLHPSQFNIFNIQDRLEKKGDLFAKVLTGKNDIKKAMNRLNK